MAFTASRAATYPLGAQRRGDRAATRTVVAAFGVVACLAGLEHGVGEILQGSSAPNGFVIESWAGTAAFDILSGEPAMTIIPNLLITGILAVGISLAFGVWAVTSATRPRGGAILIGISVLLLLFGGGFGPPLMGVLLGLAALRPAEPARTATGPIGRILASSWRTFTTIGIAGYLALMPGTIMLKEFAGIESAGLVSLFAAVAFGGLLLALPAARAADRAAAPPAGLASAA